MAMESSLVKLSCLDVAFYWKFNILFQQWGHWKICSFSFPLNSPLVLSEMCAPNSKSCVGPAELLLCCGAKIFPISFGGKENGGGKKMSVTSSDRFWGPSKWEELDLQR